MQPLIYINIPFFVSSQTQSQLNTEEITLYLLENLYESDLYAINTQIYYIYVGNGCDGIREHNFNELLKQRPYYSNMHLLGTYPTTNEKDTTKIMTLLYKHVIDHFSCYWNILFINLYEIISIYLSSSLYVSSIPDVSLHESYTYDITDSYDPFNNLMKKYNIISNISFFLTTYIPVENIPITNMSILQKNWMDYLIYFYITNYNILVAELRTSNVVGIDLQKTPKLQYSANIWWSTSNYIHTLIYYEGVCTESIFNGLNGGLYRSIWNSKINWTTNGMAIGYNYDTLKNAVSPVNYENAKIINGNDYIYYDIKFKKPTNTPYYYGINTDENTMKSILEIDDISLKKGFFFKTNQCFSPIVKNTIYKPQNRLQFGYSNNIQYGELLINTKNKKTEKTQSVNSICMTRNQLSYIHPQISACDYRKRLLIWNKKKSTKSSFEPEEKTRTIKENKQSMIEKEIETFISTPQNEEQKQRIQMKMLF